MEQKWDLSKQLVRTRGLPWGWQGDGLLIWAGAGDDLTEFALKSKMPAVDLGSQGNTLKIPRVMEDHSHAARLTGEHFLARKFVNFIYYSHRDCREFEQRGHYFSRFVQQSGHDYIWLRWHHSATAKTFPDSWKRRRQWLARQLRLSQQPLAVFAADDQHAVEVLDACEFAGLIVPDQVAIVGAGNALLAPEALSVPISSVDTDLEAVGYRGAGLLDQLINGEPAPEAPVLVPAAGLVTRRSSEIRMVDHPGVDDCLRFIKSRMGQPVDLADLQKVSSLSRNDLYQAFWNHLGQTPMQQVTQHRIEHGKKLLVTSNISIREIAVRCGYQSPRSFFAAFKRQTGMPPNQYRQKSRSEANGAWLPSRTLYS